MKCPKCKREIPIAELGNSRVVEIGPIRRLRSCTGCSHKFETVERIAAPVVGMPMKRRMPQERGVRFEVCIGDDEPGARKP